MGVNRLDDNAILILGPSRLKSQSRFHSNDEKLHEPRVDHVDDGFLVIYRPSFQAAGDGGDDDDMMLTMILRQEDEPATTTHFLLDTKYV